MLDRGCTRPSAPTNGLWLSAVSGRPMIKKAVGTLVSKITFEALGVDVSPHLFRTAAASTAATYGGSQPHLASALLNHTDHASPKSTTIAQPA